MLLKELEAQWILYGGFEKCFMNIYEPGGIVMQ